MYDTAFLDLPPLVGAAGSLRLPGSKSISNRVLLLAGLAAGETIVHDLLDADDTQVMLAALQQLGCAIARSGTSVRVTGLAGRLAVHRAQLFLGNAEALEDLVRKASDARANWNMNAQKAER